MLRRYSILVLLLGLAVASIQAKAEDEKAADEVRVSIKGMKYNPAKITIKPGQSVRWTNLDDHDHTVVADDGKSFDSGSIGNGGSFTHKFEKAGKFAYSCIYHPRMKGVVTVAEENE
jgi:plastocyanin